MKKWVVSFVILAGVGFALFVSRQRDSYNSEKENINQQTAQAPAAGTSVPANTEPALNTTQPSPALTEKPAANADPALNSKELTRQKSLNDKAELEKFKAINKTYAVKVERMMKSNEIASLRQSIAEDEQTLKKIESSGSDIEGYKFVEKNLQVRKARLKQLLQ